MYLSFKTAYARYRLNPYYRFTVLLTKTGTILFTVV